MNIFLRVASLLNFDYVGSRFFNDRKTILKFFLKRDTDDTESRQYTFSNSFATVPRERFPFVPLMRLIAKPFTGVKAIDDATLRLLRERKFKIEKNW